MAQNYKERFWWNLAEYSEYSRIEFVCFSFHVGLLVITLSSLKLHTKNNACFFWKSWVALKRAGFNAENAQKWRPLAFTHARNHTCHWSIASSMMSWDRLDQQSMRRCLSSLTSPTGVLYTPSCIKPQILYYVCVSADYVCQILWA